MSIVLVLHVVVMVET